MYIYTYTYIYTYIYKYIYNEINIYIYIYEAIKFGTLEIGPQETLDEVRIKYIYICKCIYIYIYICKCIDLYVCLYI